MNIFVARLDYGIDSGELQDYFEKYGEVSSCKIITDRDTGRSKGFGFVEMDNDDEAQAAIDGLNEYEINGREILVKKAEDKKRDNNRGGGGGGYNRGGGGGYNRGGGGGGYNRGGGGGYNRGGGDNRGGGGGYNRGGYD